MKKLKIRYLKSTDLDEAKKLLELMWSKHIQKEKEFINQNEFEDVNFQKYFKKSLENDNEFSLIAEKDNKVVGIVRVQKIKLESIFKIKNVYYLDDLSVLPEFQNQGIATHLIKSIIKIATKNKIEGIQSRIYEFNTPSQNLFFKANFKKLYSEYFFKI